MKFLIFTCKTLHLYCIIKWEVKKMKKNTLFKVIAIMFLVFAVLSWIIPASQASGSEIMNIGLSRVSLHKLIDYIFSRPHIILFFAPKA
mgnify:CR=1 FL=1